MKRILAIGCLLLGIARAASAQTAIIGDAWTAGPLMVGTTTASAQMTVVSSTSSAAPAFQVSGVDLTPLLRLDPSGSVGLSTYSAAELDVNGSGDSSNVGLMLRNGEWYGSTGAVQISLGASGTTNEDHQIASVHFSSTAQNGLNFSVWTPSAEMNMLSLVTISTASGASVHVQPVGEPVVELVVSNGATTGVGTIELAAQVSPSSRRFKTDISYLDDAAARQAYENVKSLNHVSFRYKRWDKKKGYVRDRKAVMHRGLLYEEAPASLRGPGDSVILDQRLLESEMAFQELARKLESLEKEVVP